MKLTANLAKKSGERKLNVKVVYTESSENEASPVEIVMKKHLIIPILLIKVRQTFNSVFDYYQYLIDKE